jgi:hypothetical protein
MKHAQGTPITNAAPKPWPLFTSLFGTLLAGLLCLFAGASHADTVSLLEEDFESELVGTVWELTGDWRFRINSPCLPNDPGFITPETALVFDYAGECAYRNSRSGFATLRQDVLLPITAPTVSLKWWDYVGAEEGHDFYFVQVSTDGGQTWPHEVFRDSVDEDFWDEEEVDLSQFVGQSIRIRFGFSADDSISNLGWYVDDVRIEGEALPAGVSALAIQDAKFMEGLTIDDVTPGDPNPAVVEFRVVVDPPNAQPITFNHATVDGTALSGLDFVTSSGQLTIPPNTSSFVIPFTKVPVPGNPGATFSLIVDDLFFENTEAFGLLINSASSNAFISIGDASATIEDNEALTYLYEEDFEGNQPGQFRFDPSFLNPNTPVNGWQMLEDSQCLSPELGYSSESRALVFNSGDPGCSYYTPGGVEGIVAMTAPVLINGVDALSAQVRFMHYLEIAFNTDAIEAVPTRAYVEASKQGGVAGSWKVLREFGPDQPGEDHFVLGWQEEIIDLRDFLANDPPLDPLDPQVFNVFNNENVLLRFRFVQPQEDNPNTAAGWYIDDLKFGIAPRPTDPLVSKLSVTAPWAPNTPNLPDYQPKAATEGNLGTTKLRFPVRLKPVSTEPITIAFETVELETTIDNTRGTTSTKERTIERRASVCGGSPNGFADPTDITDQWDGFPQNTFANLGAYTTNCTPAEISALFFSEYVEGSGSNKALEIFNGTGAPVDLSTYDVELYPNGSARPSDTLTLSDIQPFLASGDTLVIANAGADPAILAVADITSKVTAFNGNDAIALRENGALVDVIGVIGSDPGSEWGIGKVRHAATADVDYVSASGTITIPAGTNTDVTPVFIDVLLIGDDQPEPAEEYFNLRLNYVTQNYFLVNEEVTGVIYDDDVPSTFDVFVRGGAPGDTTVDEGDGTVQFTVQIDPPRSVPIGVTYKTINGSALGGQGLDFVPAAGIITFPANVSQATISVTILDDDAYEDADDMGFGDVTPDPESFFIGLTTQSPFATGGEPREIFITENDAFDTPPAMIIGDTSVTEGSCATISATERCNEIDTGQPVNEAVFTVEVSPAPTLVTGNYAVSYATADVSAVAGEDYEATSGMLVFGVGETTKEVNVRVWADRGVEGDETFQLVLSNPQGEFSVVTNTGVATIRDDDYLATAFGVNGTFVTRRNLDEEVAETEVLAGGASADFTAAEFMSFNFDTLYGWDGNDLEKISLTTGIRTVIATVTPPGLVTWSGLAWDHTNGKMYASETGGKIYEIDLSDGSIVGAPIVSGTLPIVAIAVHPSSGRLYAVTNDGAVAKLHVAIPGKDALVEVSTLDGVIPSAVPAEHPFWDCDFDDAGGVLYLNAYVLNDGLVTLAIDVLEAASTLVFSNPEVSSLALAAPPTPEAVLWSNDLYFASTAPSGTSLIADSATWSTADVGFAVSGVGDVNGDAYEDLIVTAPDANGGQGEVFLFFGSPDLEEGAVSEIVTTWLESDFTFAPAFFDGEQAVLLRGAPGILNLGRSVTGLDDVNGDLIADFALGYDTADGAGGVFVIFGSRTLPGTILTTSIGSTVQGAPVGGLRIPGAAAGDDLGFAVSGAGDLNGDGFGDMLLGAPSALAPSGGNPGAVYVLFGASAGLGNNGVINLSGLTRQRGVTLYGEKTGDQFGYSLDGAGDVNGDGLDDLIAGAPLADFRTATQASPGSPDSVDEGAAFVLYGHPDYGTEKGPLTIELRKLSNAVFSPPEAASPNKLGFTSALPALGTLDTTINPQNDLLNTLTGALPGYRLRGNGGRLGASVAGVGDLNGNGIDEVAVGAPDYDGSLASEAHWGRAYLLYGDDGRGGVIQANSVGTVHRGQILTGFDNGDLFGGEVAAAGDLNGDGFMDVAFGVAAATPGGFSGEVYVLWGGITDTGEKLGTLSTRDLAGTGGPGSLGRYYYNTQGGNDFAFGRSVSAAGDFNNDNVGDLIVGRKGGAFLLYGGENPVMATYVNRMRSGENGTPTIGDGGTVTSGDEIYRGVGEIGGRSFSAPASRVRMRFTGGGTGTGSKDLSTQRVTLVREESPDVIVGSGSPEDDAAWVPGGVYWNVQTDRDDFNKWEIEFYYRPEEVAGLDLQRVGIFRAKESIDSVGEFTTWFWLPFTHDPDRKVFTVKQTYPSNPEPNTPTPQELFNGTYALVQADLVTELGKEIRPVGVTRENVYEEGPDFTPGMAFWHKKEKKLYATMAGAITVEWKNTVGQTVSVIQGKNKWPADNSGLFQPYISGSPNVPMGNTGGLFEFQTVRLVGVDNSSEPIGINSNKEFFASLTGAAANQAVRALVLLSDDANPDRGNIFFQFLRVVKSVNPTYRVGAFTGVPWFIGTSIGADTDPAFAANHDDVCGSPYLISTNTPYAPKTDRYPGFYDQATRTGTIVPVNVLKSGDDDMVLTFYQAGRRLIDAKTGNQIRDPRNLQPLNVFCWPHVTRKYNPQWAPNDQVDTIIISNQNGTGSLDPGVYGTEIDIYVQNDPNLDGFNPNEEHALIAPFGAGIAIFALRDDLNGTESQPFVLMTYTDPNDLTVAGQPRAKMKPWRVVAQTAAFPFAERPGVAFPDDLYEGAAGSIINPPYPLSVLRISPDNTFSGGPVWKDRNGSLWAVAATGPSEAEKINMRFYYPVLEGFYFPAKYKTAYSGVRTFTGSSPDDVPWLDGGVSLTAPAAPVKVQYITTWPATAPQMRLGDILIGPKQGLPAINGQCSVNVIYQESTDVTKTASPAPSVELIDPVVTRSVFLEEVPTDIKTGFQGTSLIFTDLPPALQFRVSYNQGTQRLEMKGILIEPTAGDDYVLLNVLTATDIARLTALSTDADWLAAVTALANTTTGAGSVKQVVERGYQSSLPANITAAATTIKVATGTGAKAPAVPFLLEIRDKWNPIDREVVLVTAKSGDDLTVTRAQRETTAKAFQANDIVQNYDPKDAPVDPPEVLALSTGNAQGTGYVTLAFGGAEYCDPLPISLQIIRVVDDIVPGGIAVVEPGCVFEETLTLLHTNAFNGVPENFYFEWLYLPPDLSPKPFPDPPDVNDPSDPWTPPPLTTGPSAGVGLNEITIAGPGLLTLTDNWFAVRYKRNNNAQPWGSEFSDWTPIQLAPGWLKRVVGQINPFTQRASGGGIAGAESSFASFGSEAPNRIVSMISQAGPRWDGDVPLSCETIDDFGLIPIYETVLGRGADLSIRALPPIDHPGVNTALLLVASRVNDLYTLVGNEAYADAQDPTIGFGTDDGTYGQEATSIHAFMNQVPSLLHEELALLRGRDDVLAPSIQTKPFYNKLVWNFSNDITGGEVAYALNYNIRDVAEGPGVGVISEDDAKRLYPQGHGDAWGHYLTAMKSYYKLLTHPFYTWVPRSETILVGGQPLTVDYLDERKFARTAAAKAQSGAEIVELSYREVYTENPEGQYLGYKDDNVDRAWGFSEWSSRAGQGTYIDWVVGNAIMRSNDPNPFNEGIARVDRFTVPELRDIASSYDSIEAAVDKADLGLNPLGLGSNVIPFDISPSEIDDGKTHFEQIFDRAVTSINNAAAVFDRANNSTQLLRQQADTQAAFDRGVVEQELDFNARLVEIFGYPYPEDIGPGKTYPTGYSGPDLYHYMYRDKTAIEQDAQLQSVYFQNSAHTSGVLSGLPTITESMLATFTTDPKVNIGDGDDVTFKVKMANYLTQGNFGEVFAGATTLGESGQTEVLPRKYIDVAYNMEFRNGSFGLVKPAGWSARRAPGELQLATDALQQAVAEFMKGVDDYGGLVGEIEGQVAIVVAQYGLSADKLSLLNTRKGEKETTQDIIFGLKTALGILNTAASVAEAAASWFAESIPTVTGIIVGFSNGVIIDGLAPARGALGGVGVIISEALKAAATAVDLTELRLTQQGERKDDQLTIDTTNLEGKFANLQSIKELESKLRSEVPLRIALHTQYQAVLQAVGNYQKTLAEGQRLVDRRELFRNQTAADIQSFRYKDAAFRIFRNDALQKYRAQYDLASRYVYLAAKAYDYETTMLPSDTMAGQRFLTDIVKARSLGTITDGIPQTGTGLANSMAMMARNFEVLSTQLGFNNPQIETNRFSLRTEFLRTLPDEEGDPVWSDVLARDYQTHGIGTVDNLWDVPEFRRYCVPPDGFNAVEPGIIIPFSTSITEGENFFGAELGGFDSSYDSTQFATKIRSVGIWFSNYDFLNLSNTPRVYLIPVGNDLLRSPTGFSGTPREFVVTDQLMPVPFPITVSELDDPAWIPSIDSLSGTLSAIRRFGRVRAYHDSGEFSPSEVNRDSRLIGRSVWNTKWMLIIPGSTLHGDAEEGLRRFIDGRLLDPSGPADGERDGNGVSDVKLFFETYAFPRLKK